MKKGLFGVLLSFALLLAMMPVLGMSMPAYAAADGYSSYVGFGRYNAEKEGYATHVTLEPGQTVDIYCDYNNSGLYFDVDVDYNRYISRSDRTIRAKELTPEYGTSFGVGYGPSDYSRPPRGRVTLTVHVARKHKVTFKVENGAWDDGSTESKTVTVYEYAGKKARIAGSDIPAVGNRPDDKYMEGKWDKTPDPNKDIRGETIYTYTYAVDTRPYYTWAEDNSSVTATRLLKNKTAVTETVNTTSTVTTAPFCEREGATTYTAVFRDPAFETQKKTVTNIPAYGHNWGNATYSWSADNRSVVAKRVCSREPRSHYETEVVSTTISGVKPADCEHAEETTYTAVFSKEAFSKQTKTVENGEALGHEWIINDETDSDGFVITREATDDEPGSKTRTCSRDESHKETVEIPPKKHKHNMTHVDAKEASCESRGNKAYYECTGSDGCGLWFEDEAGTKQVTGSDVLIPARGHKAGDQEEINLTQPSCSSVGGYTVLTKCSNCKKVCKEEHVTFPFDPDIHDWDEGRITKEATCTERGVRTYTCISDESHTRTEEIDRLGHTAGEEVTENRTDPTCTEAGYHDSVVRCTVCNEAISSKRIQDKPALGHVWSEWKVTKNASKTEAGEETRKCSRCNETETRTVPATGPSGSGDDKTAATGTTHKVGAGTYVVKSADTVWLKRAAKNKKSFTVPAAVKIKGKAFKVTGINAKTFKGTKVKTLTVRTGKLTKKSVKGSLKGSKIKTVKVKVGKKKVNKQYVKKYKKIFTKKNAGRKVSVK